MMHDKAELNEVTEAARDAKRVADAAAASNHAEKPQRWPLVPIGIGVGIGSAALAAALLYTNAERRKR